jgi:hypothetical protein
MSGITLEGKLLMLDQKRAFKGGDVVRFLKHVLSQIPGKLLIVWDGARPSIAPRSSRSFSKAEQPSVLDSNSCPVTHRNSTPTKVSGST